VVVGSTWKCTVAEICVVECPPSVTGNDINDICSLQLQLYQQRISKIFFFLGVGFWELGGEKNVPQMGTCSMGWFQVFHELVMRVDGAYECLPWFVRME